MPEVYAAGNGAIRARINASGAALALFRPGERNRIIREALVFAGNMWLGKFKPLRFTDHVQRAPFGYPKRPTNLATTKLRTAPRGPLFDLWQGIKLREFRGWDPWSPISIPRALVDEFIRKDRARYTKKGGRIDWKELHADIRAWAKKRTREYAGNLAEDGVMLPLVMTGDLRDVYTRQSRATATATAARARLTITMPRGNRQNKWAVRILGMLPVWEFNQIVKWFDVAFSQGLAKGLASRFAQSPDGRSVGAGPARSAGAGAGRRVGAAA